MNEQGSEQNLSSNISVISFSWFAQILLCLLGIFVLPLWLELKTSTDIISFISIFVWMFQGYVSSFYSDRKSDIPILTITIGIIITMICNLIGVTGQLVNYNAQYCLLFVPFSLLGMSFAKIEKKNNSTRYSIE